LLSLLYVYIGVNVNIACRAVLFVIDWAGIKASATWKRGRETDCHALQGRVLIFFIVGIA
jgi:hypothetical protein